MRFGLEPFILDDICEVLQRYPNVEKAVIYGSRATGDFRNNSDIDIAIFAKTMDRDEFAQLWFEIDCLPIVFTMDIVHFETLNNSALKNKIQQNGVEFYRELSFAID